ncbi:MAG: hypothetical protein ACRDYV_10090 [Acidimicrobiia bacterium]
MITGDLKRLGFLVGLIALFFGGILLIDPMAVDERVNCGSALIRKKLDPYEQIRYSRRCDAKLDRRRWPGIGIFTVGFVLVVTIRPGIMLSRD